MVVRYRTLSALATWELSQANTLYERWSIARTALDTTPSGVMPKMQAMQLVASAAMQGVPPSRDDVADVPDSGASWPAQIIAADLATLHEMRTVYSLGDLVAIADAKAAK